MQKLVLSFGAISGLLGICLGAFGAHAMKKMLEESGKLEVYETAVKYQFYHAFALLILGILMQKAQPAVYTYSGYAFMLGTVIFSGSLYILCFSGISKWGAVTPIGGVILIVGWGLLLLGILRTY